MKELEIGRVYWYMSNNRPTQGQLTAISVVTKPEGWDTTDEEHLPKPLNVQTVTHCSMTVGLGKDKDVDMTNELFDSKKELIESMMDD